MNQRVSIITPTYRHAKVIAECIESVRAQTYQDWEQIIVDDGSDDDTLAIARWYAQSDSRIHVVSQEHKGVDHLADTYNRGLSLSSGRWIAILEGDDYWPPDKLAIQVPIHRTHPNVILSHGATLIATSTDRLTLYPQPPEKGLKGTKDYLRWVILKSSCIMPVSVMIQRGALEAIGGFQQSVGFPAVDYTTWLRLFEEHTASCVFFSDRVLGYWRQSPFQVTRTHGIEMGEGALSASLKSLSRLPVGFFCGQDRISARDVFASHFRATLSGSYLEGLRQALTNHDFQVGRYCIGRLLRYGSIKRKTQALVGLLFMMLGLNMEWIFNLAKRFLLRNATE